MLSRKRTNILLLFFSMLLIPFAVAEEASDYISLKQSFEDGFYSLALNAGKGFIKRYPESSFKEDVYLIRGISFFNLQKHSQAVDALVVLKNSKNLRIKDQTYFYLAKLYRLGNQADKAIELYESLLECTQDEELLSLTYYELGKLYLDSKRYLKVVEVWQNILEKSGLPENIRVDLIQNIILSYLKIHKIDEAERLINQYLKHDEVDFYYFSADVDFLKGNYSASLEKFSKIIDSDFSAIWQQRAILGQTRVFIELENYRNAEEILSTLEDVQLSEISDEFYYLKAFLFYKKSEFSPAIRYYQKFVTKFKNSEWAQKAFLELIDCFYNLNKLKLAEKTAQKFFDTYSGHASEDKIHHILGWVYYKGGEIDKAIKEFEWVARNSKDIDLKINALCRVGDLLSEEGKFDEAMEQYNSVLKNYPNSLYAEYAQCQLGIYLLEKGDYEAAILALRAALENFPKSSLLDKVHFHLALAYFKKRDFELALDEINTLLISFPLTPLKEKALLQKAVLLYNLSSYQEVKNLISGTASLSNKDYARFILAKVYVESKEYQLAQKEYNWLKENLKDQELLPYLYLQIGELKFYLKEWDGAYADFQNAYYAAEAVEVKEQALYWQAWCYYNKKDLDKALDVFTQLLDSKTLFEEAKYNSVLVLNAQGKYDKSVKILEEIVKDGGRFQRLAVLKLGDIFKSFKEYEKAIEQYKELEEVPYDIISAEASFKIGDIYEIQGDIDQAVLQYLSLGALYKADLSFVNKARVRCGRLLENAGRLEEAEKIYAEISSSSGEEAIYARERLKQLNEMKLRR
ncbi:MAG: tetratricopeptide repeat protein [Candidatus Saelkia tenebricola]|nr:tetratricopeptide repeat protein [Candidatus Saelkia tenebricola]